MTSFSEWLQGEIDRRGWNSRRLALEAQLDPGTVSNVLNEMRKPGPDFCRGVARALNIPQPIVFYRAGLITELDELDEEGRELVHLFSQLQGSDRQDLLDLALAKLARLKRGKSGDKKAER